METFEGTALKYGDNINTDIISPPQYMELPIEEAAQYAMGAVDPDFAKRVQKGDFFVAEQNLGLGSSRETAPLTLKYLGIRAVIAQSFARIFYRNLINLGIPALECQNADKIKDGDRLLVDLAAGQVQNLTSGENYACAPLPANILELIEAGGLVAAWQQGHGAAQKPERSADENDH